VRQQHWAEGQGKAMRVEVTVAWLDGLVLIAISIIKIWHQKITLGSRREICHNQRGGEATARQASKGDER